MIREVVVMKMMFMRMVMIMMTVVMIVMMKDNYSYWSHNQYHFQYDSNH